MAERADALLRRGKGSERASTMGELLEGEGFAHKRCRQGDIVEGKLVRVSREAILVDVGAKCEGIVASRELEELSAEELAELREGDPVLVYVLNPEGREGNPILSLEKARLYRDWRRAEERFRNSEVFSAAIVDFNKGGFIVGVGEIRGFLPLSQVEGMPRRRREGTSLKDWMREIKGKEVQVKIIEMDQRRNRLILSQREAERQRRQERKRELMTEIAKGQTIRGVVSSLCEFGVFVDLGGADGLVHISELSWKRGVKPEAVVKVGDEVQVYVLDVDPERGRIALSLKQLQQEPWSEVGERYKVGQVVEGTITKLTNFGAFALLDEYIEGLIHISELSDRKISHPKEVVKEGDVVALRVLQVDTHRKRIALSLRQVDKEEYEGLDWRAELAQSQLEAEAMRALAEADLGSSGEVEGGLPDKLSGDD